MNIENFDSRMFVENDSFRAWGYLEYKQPLTEKQISDYELRAATPAVQEKEHTSVLDTLRKKQAEIKASAPKKKPKAKEECR